MANQNLADLVTLSQDEANLILKIAKTTQPVKPFALKETGKRPDGTAVYEVPKSDIFAYFARDLADGSVITCMRRKPISFARRMALYEAGVANGFNVKLPTEDKAKAAKPAAMTLESLTAAKGKGNKVTKVSDL